jgi:hypothetical protein
LAADASAFNARVKLVVKAEHAIQSTLENHLRAALQAIPDVTVTGDEPTYQLEVFVSEMGAATGFFGSKNSLGIALSVLVTQRNDTEGLTQRLKAQVDEATAQWVAAHVRGYVFVRGHWLEVATARQLEETARAIVTTFNKKILDLDRPAVKTDTVPATQTHSE